MTRVSFPAGAGILSATASRPASWQLNGQGVKLTTHSQLVLRLRMHRAIPPLPPYSSMT